ncbi:MAG: 16S rRNA (uracil(1498)-N(3))-methyltransferase, partial [Nitrososphaeraceae archaeon]|nr:16S rRNA (uracil(1498)-N(3))-methyltransferase [Nitrososphaeraceae archaeon]
QKSSSRFEFNNSTDRKYYFLFGPEGGFDESEINQLKPDNIFNLGVNRLRSETAIVKCASLINYFST